MNPLKPLIGASVSLPLSWFDREGARELRQSLTFTPVASGFGDDDPEPIHQYVVDRESGYVLVPYYAGRLELKRRKVKASGFIDLRTRGTARTWPRSPVPRDNAQEAFFNDILRRLEVTGCDFACAKTGTGKTVAVLNAASKLGVTVLAIVPSIALARQWINEAKKHCGLTDDEVGQIGGGKKNWEGKTFVAAVVNSAARLVEDPAFVRYFGMVAWDEGHRMAARTFAPTLMAFPARYRVVVSATPKRKDGMTDLIHSAVGPVGSTASVPALPVIVEKPEYDDPRAEKLKDLPPPTLMSLIAKDQRRNRFLASIIARAASEGRKVLGLSDRIEQLYYLKRILVDELGIPEERIATFAGREITGIEKKKVKGKVQTTVTERTVSVKERDAIKENPDLSVYLATYSAMKEGVDIPPLDTGIELMPKATLTQSCGRIRRVCPGKQYPLWYSVIDVAYDFLVGYAFARFRELGTSGNVTYRPFTPPDA